ncbi:hypothetical protein DdX_02628 [Ditylenchus destructor]|uniref:Uncharacterized protein n=1 Tax=Ditylenchus destructor TaxID=166010 RepID=A0AAD4NEK8_9BILA|nr:hypothetical protein DdX_02628 [Ditylenchus destructor]
MSHRGVRLTRLANQVWPFFFRRINSASVLLSHAELTSANAGNQKTIFPTLDLLHEGFQLVDKGEYDKFREIMREQQLVFKKHNPLAKNIDTFLWRFLREHFSRIGQPLDNEISIARAFDLYIILAQPYGLELPPGKKMLQPCTTFNLLNLAYADYKEKIKRDPSSSKKEHIFMRILDCVEHSGSKYKRMYLYGAVMLANNETLIYFDEMKSNGNLLANEERLIDFVRYLIVVADVTKQPKILQPLVELPDLLPPNRPSLIVDLYNELALLYGKKDDFENIEQLVTRIQTSDKISENLYRYTHVLNRIRHFYKMSNKLPPKNLLVLCEKAHEE